jgi:hypothetical protein
MKIILTKLIKNFDFKLVDNQNLAEAEYLTFRPADGAKCYITPRTL